MAARGSEEKLSVLNKIKEVFPNAFEYENVLRIPIRDVQIKVVLTCAKDNVEVGGDTALPGKTVVAPSAVQEQSALVEPSQEELDAINSLMASLNL